jgi:hypothetical protein
MIAKWKFYCLLAVFYTICCLFVIPGNCFAKTYYIRPYDSTKHNGDGLASDWAASKGTAGCWNGIEGAKSASWTSVVGGGDTVYFIGTFVRERKNRTGVFDVDFPAGSNGNYVVFRGDHPDGDGILTSLVKDSAPGGIYPPNWDYIFALGFDQGNREPQYGDLITNGISAAGKVTHVNKTAGDWSSGDSSGIIYVWKKSGVFSDNDPIRIDGSTYAYVSGGDASQTNTYFNEGFKIYDRKGLFEYFNSISDHLELRQKNDVTSVIQGSTGEYYEEVNIVDGLSFNGYWINPHDPRNLTSNKIRFSEFPGYRMRMDRDGDYMHFYKLKFYGAAPTINTYNTGGSSDYVKWEECYFWRTPAFLWPAGTFNHWTWTGNVHDGDGFVAAGHIYNTCVNPATSIINNWIIEKSYFSGVHRGSDAHALGFQGNANNIIIRYNTITDCGSGIVLWKGNCGTQNNFTITHNYIFGLNGDHEPSGRSKCHGIVMQGSGQESRKGIVIAHNVLEDPLNCDYSSDDYHGLGIRTVSKSGYNVKVYNNTVKGYPVSFEFEGNSRENDVDFRNNISLEPGFYHVHSNGYSMNAKEDYNCYHASSDDKMWYYAKKKISVSSYNEEVNRDSEIFVNANTVTGNPLLKSNMVPGDASSPVVNAGVSVDFEYLLSSFLWPDKTVGSALPQTLVDSSPDIGAYTLETDQSRQLLQPPINLRVSE